MRLIAPKRLVQYGRQHPDARASLGAWRAVAERANWSSIQDVRKDFPTADGVEVRSGRTATVFNVRGGNYRLITAIHYNRKIVFVMRFLTHAAYDKDAWKEQL